MVGIYDEYLTLEEQATPTAKANHAKIYSKTDNRLYHQDGAGNEHESSSAGECLGEMYMYESAGVVTIDTTDVYHMVAGFSTGLVSEWTFDDTERNGQIADTFNNGGQLQCEDVGHGLVTGDIVALTGMGDALHNGITQVTRDTDDLYTCDDIAFNSIDDTGNWAEGSYLTAGTGAAGIYDVSYHMTVASAAASKNLKFEILQNNVEVDKTAGEMTPSGTNHQNSGGGGYLTIAEGDRIYLICKNETDGENINLEHGNVKLHKI